MSGLSFSLGGAAIGGLAGALTDAPGQNTGKIAGAMIGGLVGLASAAFTGNLDGQSGGTGVGGGTGKGAGVGPGADDDEGSGAGGIGEGCGWVDYLLGNCGKGGGGTGNTEGTGGDSESGTDTEGTGGENETEGEGGGGTGEGEQQQGPRVCALPAGDPSGEELNEFYAQLEDAAGLASSNLAGYEASLPAKLKGSATYKTYAAFKAAADKAGMTGVELPAYVWVCETDRRYNILDVSKPVGDEGCRVDAALGGYHAMVLDGLEVVYGAFGG